MPKFDLNDTEYETLVYALGVAEGDLVESIADPAQSEEDRAEWTAALAETRALIAKVEALAEEEEEEYEYEEEEEEEEEEEAGAAA